MNVLDQARDAGTPPAEGKTALLEDIKRGRRALRIPIRDRHHSEVGHLAPLTTAHLGDIELIHRFVRWRNQFRSGWLDQRPVTVDGTQRWLQEVVENPTRMTFLIYFGETLIGRCGFLNLTRDRNESDGLVRGERGGGADLIHCANVAGLDWQFRNLGIRAVHSKVLSTNELALQGCRRLGYSMPPIASKQIFRHVYPEGVVLREFGDPDQELPDVRLLYLRLEEKGFGHAVAGWREQCT
jgi:RimJ/RimL family protein N-acetyltransferase